MTNIRAIISEVVSILETEGHHESARDLINLSSQIKDTESEPFEHRMSIVIEVMNRAHPKWLGDLNIKSIEYKEWSNLLQKMYKAAKAIKYTS